MYHPPYPLRLKISSSFSASTNAQIPLLLPATPQERTADLTPHVATQIRRKSFFRHVVPKPLAVTTPPHFGAEGFPHFNLVDITVDVRCAIIAPPRDQLGQQHRNPFTNRFRQERPIGFRNRTLLKMRQFVHHRTGQGRKRAQTMLLCRIKNIQHRALSAPECFCSHQNPTLGNNGAAVQHTHDTIHVRYAERRI
jgi:hypothetical protein